MKRFGKVALLLAAIFVMTCGAAYAAPLPNVPGDLEATLDAFVLSGDVSWRNNHSGAEFGRTILSPDETGKPGLDFLSYSVTFSKDVPGRIGLKTDSKLFGEPGSLDFDMLLARTTQKTFNMNFDVTSLDPNIFTGNEPAHFGLWGSYETTAPRNTSLDLAQDCTIDCGNFYFYMPHAEGLSSTDLGDLPVERTAQVRWTGAGDEEFYVECCDDLGFNLVSGGIATKNVVLSSDRRNVVYAHLSETPFVRVRVADALDVVSKDPFNAINASWDIDSRDFRNDWAMSDFFDDNVDVPQGETYNLGVQYTHSSDCLTACDSGVCANKWLPFVAVTNLGTESVFIGNNYEANNVLTIPDWLCNSWCGLCAFDSMMSGDKGSLGYSKTDLDVVKAQSALYDCICHIYPAFTSTFKAAGNEDILWDSYTNPDLENLAASIRGRLNVDWKRDVIGTSGVCDSCEQEIYIYYPCDCLVDEYRRDILGEDSLPGALVFATKDTVTIDSYNEDPADGEYAAINAVLEVPTTVAAADVPNILLTKLTWDIDATQLDDAGLVGGADWWRKVIWEKMQIKVNGFTLDESDVTNVSANDMTPAELAFLTTVIGPQRQLTSATVTDIDVNLFVFVFDGTAPGEDTADVKYYKNTTTGNRYLVLFDGNEDGLFSYSAAVSKKVTTPVDVFAVSPATLSLNLAIEADNTKTLTAVNAPLGATINWEVASGDEAFVVVSPDTGATVEVTGLAVGTATVRATVEGTAETATCAVTVVDEPTPPVPGGSSGGCSMGFAPAALLLLAPLFFLKR